MKKRMKLFKGRLVLIDGALTPACIVVSNGKIVSVTKGLDLPDSMSQQPFETVIDAGDLVLMPGVVDSHVHVNEPGRTDWEGFATATRAAAKGGITTIVDMPLNSIPPTTTLDNLKTKLKAAEGQCFVDVAFWGGVVPGNAQHLKEMVDYGVVGFKCFLVHSGVEEFPCVNEAEVMAALEQLKGTDSVLLFHAELEIEDASSASSKALPPSEYQTFLNSRPSTMENRAIQLVMRACKESGVRCHIVHLGSGEAVDRIGQVQKDGVPLSVETCHHYLNLLAEEVPTGATQFKCCPPVRTRQHQEDLWRGLKEGVIGLVVSDHSPCTPDLKLLDKGDFMAAWGGISSVQFGLSLFWTAAEKRGFSVPDVNKFLTIGPAKLASLDRFKGRIAPGYDADFVIWDPQATFTVDKPNIYHKNKVTPYEGWTLKGVVRKTILRGDTIFDDGLVSPKATGSFLLNKK